MAAVAYRPDTGNRRQTIPDDVVIVFFSLSGYRFAKARNERWPFVVAPFDSLWRCRTFFDKVQPDYVVVIKYELWPGFLYTSSSSCPTWLVNYVAPREEGLKKYVYGLLFPFFDQIFTVDKASQSWVQNVCKDCEQVEVWGDTKFDSVIQRKGDGKAVEKYRFLDAYHKALMIAGSCWHQDVDVVVPAYASLPQEVRQQWRLVLAPHDVSGKMIEFIQERLRQQRLPFILFSELLKGGELGENEVVIVDTIGDLMDLYRQSAASFVGGALHFRVHNVLEPAMYGNQISFGPLFENSYEARIFVEAKVADVVGSVKEFVAWWEGLSPSKGVNKSAVAKIESLSGVAGSFGKLLGVDV